MGAKYFCVAGCSSDITLAKTNRDWRRYAFAGANYYSLA